MFGYLTASPPELTAEELRRYKSAYCGLCRAIKERHGQAARLSLNYDMVFLILLLSSLYEPEETEGDNACIVHPCTKRSWTRTTITDYCADMTVALAYLNCLDDWKDEKKHAALAASAVLKKEFCSIKAEYPRQCAAMEESIAKLSALEESGKHDPDEASRIFGRMMGDIFVFKDDRWKDLLYNAGCGIGQYIYLLDAVIDLDRDVKHGNYNPFADYCGREDNEERFREILTIFLGDALAAYNYLPLVQDTGIMKNILMSGLWQAFENKFHPPTKEERRRAKEFYRKNRFD